jgi:hypothetical protein
LEIGPGRNFGHAHWPTAANADDYGNGVVGAYNRKGMGRTLKPGP